MFPHDPERAVLGDSGRTGTTATKPRGGTREQLRSTDGDDLPLPVTVGRSVQRSTLYDSFELNAMVVRLNRLLHGDGDRARRLPPRRSEGWLAVPKVLLRKIKRAFLGVPRQGGR